MKRRTSLFLGIFIFLLSGCSISNSETSSTVETFSDYLHEYQMELGGEVTDIRIIDTYETNEYIIALYLQYIGDEWRGPSITVHKKIIDGWESFSGTSCESYASRLGVGDYYVYCGEIDDSTVTEVVVGKEKVTTFTEENKRFWYHIADSMELEVKSIREKTGSGEAENETSNKTSKNNDSSNTNELKESNKEFQAYVKDDVLKNNLEINEVTIIHTESMSEYDIAVYVTDKEIFNPSIKLYKKETDGWGGSMDMVCSTEVTNMGTGDVAFFCGQLDVVTGLEKILVGDVEATQVIHENKVIWYFLTDSMIQSVKAQFDDGTEKILLEVLY